MSQYEIYIIIVDPLITGASMDGEYCKGPPEKQFKANANRLYNCLGPEEGVERGGYQPGSVYATIQK